MGTRILVPMDDSEMARRALTYALENHPDAEITVLHVVGNPSSMMGSAAGLALEDDPEAAAEEQAEEIFDPARELAAEHDTEIETAIRSGSPASVIVTAAEAFDTVVIGSHSGSLVQDLFVGNIAKKVVSESPVPVTVVR